MATRLTKTSLRQVLWTTTLITVLTIHQASLLIQMDLAYLSQVLHTTKMVAMQWIAIKLTRALHTEPILADIALSIAGHVYNSRYIL